MKKISFVLTFLGILALLGCSPKYVANPIDPDVEEYLIKASKKDIFDVALAVSQEKRLDVAVIEKESGLIRFESTYFSARLMDSYCEYPLNYEENGQPASTFQDWDTESLEEEQGTVKGLVSLTFLIREVGEDVATIRVKSNWSVGNSREQMHCNTTGVFEQDLIDRIKLEL